MRLFIIFYILILIIAQPAFSQSKKAILKAADEAFEIGNNYGAAKLYSKYCKEDSSKISVLYRKAEAERLSYGYNNAKLDYEFVLQKDSAQFPECRFWLADVQKSLTQYEDANKNYTKYLENKKDTSTYFYKKALQEKKSCDFAINLIKNTNKEITIEHTGKSLNTDFSEYSPLQINDTLILFSSLQRDKQDTTKYHARIYQSVWKNNKWKKATKLDSLINPTDFYMANLTFDHKEQTLYFTRCKLKKNEESEFKTVNNCQIYKSRLDSGKWQKAEILPESINLKNTNNTQPAIAYTNDGKYLIFSSNRKEGHGKMDLWASKINENGSFEKPSNLGGIINSIDDEITPFYDKKNAVLYFSSKWHHGLGGFDIFRASGDFFKWDSITNLGAPVNSSYNDLYYSISPDAKNAWFASNRTGSYAYKNESCCNDIYTYKIPEDEEPETDKPETPEDEGLIVVTTDSVYFNDDGITQTQQDSLYEGLIDIVYQNDNNTGDTEKMTYSPEVDSPDGFEKTVTKIEEKLSTQVYFHNDNPNPRTYKTTTNIDYKGHFDEYMTLKNLYIESYIEGQGSDIQITFTNEINNLFDSTIKDGFQALQRLSAVALKALNKGNNVQLTISGYTSPLGSSSYNKNLAARRVSSVENFLKNYENGKLKPFYGKQLKVKKKIIGETQDKVSDNPKDKRNSVFSPAAAKARKVKIEIKFVSDKTN